MAADDYKRHFHLTPGGWIGGSRWFFNKLQVDLARPADALATFELHIRQRSEWSSENRDWTRIWKADGASDDQIAALTAQFNRPDEDSKLPAA